MPISSTVLSKTQQSAQALAQDVVTTTLALQKAAAAHEQARVQQRTTVMELGELVAFLNEHAYQHATDWDIRLWSTIHSQLNDVDLLDVGALGEPAEQFLDQLSTQASRSPTGHLDVGSTVTVRIDGQEFLTQIDEHGVQRMCKNRIFSQLFDLAQQHDVLTINKLKNLADNGHYTEQEHLEFIARGTGWSLNEVMNAFPGAEVDNPFVR